MSIHHTVIQRLAFVKYLFFLALEQSKMPEPMAAASVLTFHDSIELFLQMSCEHLNAGKEPRNLIDYWDLLSKKLDPAELPHKESMRRLIRARGLLKHKGFFPSKMDIEGFRATSSMFFEDCTKLIFCLGFSEISLIEYVSPEESRNHLKEAQDLCSKGEFEKATREIALAFEKTIDTYEEKKSGLGTRSPFHFGENMGLLSSRLMGVKDRELAIIAEFMKKTEDTIQTMQRAIKILALGLDYRKYSKFRLLLPNVTRTVGGQYFMQRVSFGTEPSPDKEYIDFCITYVIECSIKLNEFDYEFIRTGNHGVIQTQLTEFKMAKKKKI